MIALRVAGPALPRFKSMARLLAALNLSLQMRFGVRASGVPRRLAHWGLPLVRDHLGLFLVLAACGAGCWFLGGWHLRRRRLLLWDLVLPLWALALLCVVGPGHLFPKRPYEGPRLITFSAIHSLTLLDLPGLACAALAGGLSCWLLWVRWCEHARRQRRMRHRA